MGVQTRIVIWSESPGAARTAANAGFARIDAIEAALSDYRPDSEAMRLCGGAGAPPVPISRDLAEVLRRSIELSRRTDGAFDVTIGPLVQLWREAKAKKRLPYALEMEHARASVGMDRIQLAPDGRTARLSRAGTRLDFGGIGKGYAASEAVDAIRRAGFPSCMVAIAGDIAAGDPPPDSPGWRIALGDAGVVALSRRAVSTSGDAEQFIEIRGTRYSHILDPATGVGLTNRVESTVLAPDGATADALSTALCIAGPQRASAIMARFPECAARVSWFTGGRKEVWTTPGFPFSPGPG